MSALVLVAAYGTVRNGDIDEIGFLNPPYMLAHYGKLTFPGYAFDAYFDLPVITHPPVHLGLVGLLWRFGLAPYYAEATPTVLLFFLCILAIMRGAFPATVKLGLLFAIGFLATKTPPWMLCFGTRPEGHLHAAWLCGLVLLESGRLEGWRRSKLFAGAFFLTWASGVHYYAGFAAAGLFVYVVWVIRSLGWEKAKPRVLAICAGGALFGVPYLMFYLLPYWLNIWAAIRANQGTAGVAASIRQHLDLYRSWAHSPFQPALLRMGMGLGIPLLVLSTAILGVIRSTRGIALAALPLQLFVFFFASHKLESYLLHESELFAAAACIGLVMATEYVWLRLPAPRLRRAFLPAATVLLAVYLVADRPAISAAVISTQPRVHESVLARAATRQIVGTNARMGGRWGSWYSSGAAHWFNTERDLLHLGLLFDPTTYFSNLDAFAEFPQMSDSGEQNTLSSWYADGTLQLRGFYFGETNEQLQLVLLSGRRAPRIVGYAADHGKLYRFEESAGGDYAVISAACPLVPELAYGNWQHRWDGTFSSVLLLPRTAPDFPKVLVTVLTPRRAQPADWIARSCRQIQELHGTFAPADKDALLALLRQEDRPMRFYRNVEQMPGFTGAGMPKDLARPENTVRLNLVDLAHTESYPNATLEPGPPVRVTTVRSAGGFSAFIPVKHTESVSGPCWIELRLRVVAGRVAFAAFNQHTGIITRTPGLAQGSGSQDLVVSVPDLRQVDEIILFNDGHDEISKVEILDGAVLVKHNGGER